VWVGLGGASRVLGAGGRGLVGGTRKVGHEGLHGLGMKGYRGLG
jgi:hypothetical protein